jgi:Uma2 family endonuclease
MSTAERIRPRAFPPLENGQHLDQATFHERYEAMPVGTWAELVGGVVHMPSPVGLDHGEFDDDLAFWYGYYKRSTKGLRSGKNATVILGEFGEVQPDGHLRIPEEFGGQTRIEGSYIAGAPELVVEIAESSRDYDLGAKKADYERAGVLEYLVVELERERIHWFIRRGKRFAALRPDREGIYRSKVFPGLWLDPAALFARDLDRLIQVLEQGLASPEHAEFVAKLAAARSRGSGPT